MTRSRLTEALTPPAMSSRAAAALLGTDDRTPTLAQLEARLDAALAELEAARDALAEHRAMAAEQADYERMVARS